MYEKSLEKPYSQELFSIQDMVQDMCEKLFDTIWAVEQIRLQNEVILQLQNIFHS